MPRKRYNALDQFPLSAAISLLASTGRLANALQKAGEIPEPVLLPVATPIGDMIPVAALLPWPPNGGTSPEEAQGLAIKLQQAEEALQKEKNTVQKLAAELDEARRPRATHTTAILFAQASEENKALVKELNDCKRKLADWEVKTAALVVERDEERKELNDLRRENVRTRPRSSRARRAVTLEDAVAEATTNHGAQRIKEVALARLFRLVFPGLDFTRGSIYFIVQRAHNPQQTFGKLSELNSFCRVEGARRVQSTKSWFEVRYGKEGSSVDRMYYSYSSRTGRSLVVLSNKEKQDSDLRKLKRAAMLPDG